MHEILLRCGSSLYSESRDYVFALLLLSSSGDNQTLDVDHSMPLSDLSIQVVRSWGSEGVAIRLSWQTHSQQSDFSLLDTVEGKAPEPGDSVSKFLRILRLEKHVSGPDGNDERSVSAVYIQPLMTSTRQNGRSLTQSEVDI